MPEELLRVWLVANARAWFPAHVLTCSRAHVLTCPWARLRTERVVSCADFLVSALRQAA